MSVKIFLAPPAGGKTQFAVDNVHRALKEHPLAPVWVILPDREQTGAFQRRLAATGGAMGAQVATFGDAYREILECAGRAYPLALNGVTNALLHAALEELHQQGTLEYYSSIRSKPGFLQVLRDRFAELKRGLVLPEVFKQNCQDKPAGLVELARLYQAYQDKLRKIGWADHEGLSWLALETLRSTPELLGDWQLAVVDGFVEFTPAQHRALTLLAESLSELVITLPGERNMQRQVHRRSQRALQRLSGELDPQIIFSETQARLPEALAYLEKSLFAGNQDSFPTNDHFHMLEVRSPAEEAREALRWIKALVVRERIPLERCAIFTQEPDWYYRFLLEAATEFGMPPRFTWGEILAQSPPMASLIGLLELPVQGFPRRETLDAIRCTYFELEPFGLEPKDAATLELVSIHGQVTGGQEQWHEVFENLLATPADRSLESFALPTTEQESEALGEDLPIPELPHGERAQRLANGLFALMNRLFPGEERSMQAWIAWLEALLGQIHFYERCESEAREALQEALRGLMMSALISEAAPLAYNAFVLALRSALEGCSYRPANAVGRGGVFIGRLVEAQGLRFQAVAILGLSEGIFPTIEKADPFIDEETRAELGLEAQINRDQAGIFYQVLTRSDNHLLLTRPYLAEGGEAWEASHYWLAVASLFPDSIQRVQGEDIRRLENAASPQEALFWSVRQERRPHKDETLIRRAEFVEHGRQVLLARLANERRGPYEGYPLELQEQLARRFSPAHMWSASRLESYGSCPQRFYVDNALALEAKQAPELGFDVLQLGSMLHRILERTFRRLGDPHDLQAVQESLSAVMEEEFAQAPQRYGFRPGPLWEAEQADLSQRLVRCVENLVQESAGWTPVAFEQAFGIGAVAPLRMETGSGVVLLRGFIDRVDRNAQGELRVLDYKTGGSHLGKNDLIAGYRLQLPLYALGARQALGLGEPVEGLYWNIRAGEAGALKLASFKHEERHGIEAAIQTAREHVERIISGVRAAQFPPIPPKGGCPSYCPASAWCWRYEPGF
ncbi:MAG: PD-(D/E)XK nuclease family protein [Anaerolineales bacterium]